MMTKAKFSYQNLRVYEDMIRTISLAEEIVSGWDSVHAISDHFSRASEGSLVCLAEACRTRQTSDRIEAGGYSMGSILECAGCFDIAVCKSLCSQDNSNEVKQAFASVFRQLHALRRSWQVNEVRENSPSYGKVHFFNHEKLQAYELALQVNRDIASWHILDRLPRSEFRKVDEAATSIVLNIAEGNGRFPHLDHSRFLEIANRATTKLAARLEICAIRGSITPSEAAEIIGLLVQIDKMTSRLAAVWRDRGSQN